MGDWEPLGVRMGWRVDDAPYDGIPPHMEEPLKRWIRLFLGGADGQQWDRDKKEQMLEVLGQKLRWSTKRNDVADTAISYFEYDDRLVFEAIDMSLWLTSGAGAAELDLIFRATGSVWTLADKGRGIERRVEESQKEAYRHAVSAGDMASEHLREAWAKAYGVHPDPSDSWDHSIKAVEALLWDVVIPKNNLATFGKILDALEAKPAKWVMRLNSAGGDVPVETFGKMLRLMWVNPDRHATGLARPVTQDEAEDVVALAVLVVGWLRSGSFKTAS